MKFFSQDTVLGVITISMVAEIVYMKGLPRKTMQ